MTKSFFKFQFLKEAICKPIDLSCCTIISQWYTVFCKANRFKNTFLSQKIIITLNVFCENKQITYKIAIFLITFKVVYLLCWCDRKRNDVEDRACPLSDSCTMWVAHAYPTYYGGHRDQEAELFSIKFLAIRPLNREQSSVVNDHSVFIEKMN